MVLRAELWFWMSNHVYSSSSTHMRLWLGIRFTLQGAEAPTHKKVRKNKMKSASACPHWNKKWDFYALITSWRCRTEFCVLEKGMILWDVLSLSPLPRDISWHNLPVSCSTFFVRAQPHTAVIYIHTDLYNLQVTLSPEFFISFLCVHSIRTRFEGPHSKKKKKNKTKGQKPRAGLIPHPALLAVASVEDRWLFRRQVLVTPP